MRKAWNDLGAGLKYRTDVEGLRAVAVLPIVLYHFGSTVLSGGFVGVDVFFVISGFVIARSIAADIDAGRYSIANFYFKRICRILPALLALVLVTSAAATILLLPPDLETHYRSVAAVGGFVSNLFFWKSSGYFEAAAQTRPLLHTWSLAVEEQFYIFAPPLFAYLYRRWRAKWAPIILALAAVSLAISVAAVFVSPKAGYFLLPSRGWELLLGAALALGGLSGPSRHDVREFLALIGGGAIVGAILMLDRDSPFPGWNALYPCLGTAMIIYAGMGTKRFPIVNRLLSVAPLRWIGRISYSLYLVHWPIVALFQYRALRGPTAAEGAAMLVASIVLATLSWRFIEEPARQFAHRIGTADQHRGRVVMAGAAVSLAIIGAGLAGAATGGLPGRFPAYHHVAVAGQEQWGGAACFNEDPSRAIPWNAKTCTRVHGHGGRVLLWGDSYAAHYVPGLVARRATIDRDVLQYTFAGCPPILAYYSAARVGCSASNARVPGMIRAFGIDQVVMSARWDGVPLRTLERLHETVATLRALGVRVTVVGQSPLFGAEPQTIDFLSGQYRQARTASWPEMVNPQVAAAVRSQAAGASFVDPVASLCTGGDCAYRDGSAWFYTDEGHLSAAGAARAVDAFLGARISRR
jgi:peptidoglycan/LPS O-acetylase OafA/YrhL